jgi:tetrahydromethanopterin S-methyltransferase subunit A
MAKIEKVSTAAEYPPEEGCYLRGNDYSPVAVVVILKWIREETPPEIEHLVRVAVESGAALSGTLQTENIGLEKVICNLVSNPNIRYLIVFGPESPGHLVGSTILALAQNGIDENKRIIGSEAATPFLFNIPPGHVERFRKQITVIDLLNEGSPKVLHQAVWSCYQEEPTPFQGYMLHDPGAYPEPPLSGKITWRVTNPEREPKTKEEQSQAEKLKALMERVRKAVEEKKQRAGGVSTKSPEEGK